MPSDRDCQIDASRKSSLVEWCELEPAASADAPSLGDRVPDWGLDAFRELGAVVGHEAFPCLFGKQAQRVGVGWFYFVDSIEEDEGRARVAQAILAYFAELDRHSGDRAVLRPLIVMVKPVRPILAIGLYQQQAWNMFQFLHERDPEPWPRDIPTDTDLPDWTFCYAGRQLFSNVSHPAHRVRRARNLGSSLTFVMQPRTNFDAVAGNNRRGRRIRGEIRRRIQVFEGRPAPSHLSFYAAAENRDWKQMAVPDADEPFPTACPFRIRPR
jgi:FPC/CPF motif-containing protein YcgG